MLKKGFRLSCVLGLGALIVVLLPGATGVRAQYGIENGEWRTYGGDLGSTKYAPLDQINAENFNKLEVAWRFKTDMLGQRPDYNLETTPIVVRGVLYATAGSSRDVVAIDAATGELLWMYRYDEGKRAEASLRRLSGRGVGYWTDGREERIYVVTIGYQLVALDAKTGRPVTAFGTRGIVDLKQEDDQILDPITGGVAWNGAPVIAKNVVIVGAAHGGGRSKAAAKGYIRGFDARTGKRLWIFHTIAQPGEFGNETWEGDSWSYSGNAGVWSQITVDEKLGIAYLPVELATNDYYGGDRLGNNLFAESLVAVNLETGKRIWHYQLIHHGIWDYDIPCAPVLADITVAGRAIKAVAQPTKQGFVYVFDRQTGQPVWPIEERPVPQSTVSGERTSPTQPFPTKPPAYERQGFSLDELIDFTPELKAEAIKIVSQYKIGPLFTPGIEAGENGKKGLLYVPNGANWGGASLDPETSILYVFSNTLLRNISLSRPPAPANPMDAGRINSGRGQGDVGVEIGDSGDPNLTVQKLPLMRPPWGRITAIDLSKGEIVWQVAHGETPDSVRKHPALKGLKIPRTGSYGPIGTIATKTLVIAGDHHFTTTESGVRGAPLYGYDKQTGKVVGQVLMPGPQTGTPMTYMLNGKQYIVLAISSIAGVFPAELIAYKLP